MSPDFLLTALIVVIAPGAGVLFTVATGLAGGRWASLVAAFGATLGIVPHMFAAITGLAALLHASALAYEALKYLGVGYLIFLAVMALRARGVLRIKADGPAQRPGQLIVSGILLNLLNPKLSLFFLAFLPQFVPAEREGAVWQMLGLSLVFMAMTFVVFALYGVFAAAMRQRVLSNPKLLRLFNYGFAAAFVALGARLALGPA